MVAKKLISLRNIEYGGEEYTLAQNPKKLPEAQFAREVGIVAGKNRRVTPVSSEGDDHRFRIRPALNSYTVKAPEVVQELRTSLTRMGVQLKEGGMVGVQELASRVASAADVDVMHATLSMQGAIDAALNDPDLHAVMGREQGTGVFKFVKRGI